MKTARRFFVFQGLNFRVCPSCAYFRAYFCGRWALYTAHPPQAESVRLLDLSFAPQFQSAEPEYHTQKFGFRRTIRLHYNAVCGVEYIDRNMIIPQCRQFQLLSLAIRQFPLGV